MWWSFAVKGTVDRRHVSEVDSGTTVTSLFAIPKKYWTRWQAHSRPSLNTVEMTVSYKGNPPASLSTPTSALEKKVGVGLGVWSSATGDARRSGAEFCFFPRRIWDHPTTRFSRCLPLYLFSGNNKQATILPFLSLLPLVNCDSWWRRPWLLIRFWIMNHPYPASLILLGHKNPDHKANSQPHNWTLFFLEKSHSQDPSK